MHEKTAVSGLIEEIYTFLKQADARELRHLFVELDETRAADGDVDAVLDKIDNGLIVPIIADIVPVSVMKKQLICWLRK